jgi:hypothetical protein
LIKSANDDGVGRSGGRQGICEISGQASVDDGLGNRNRRARGKRLHIHGKVRQIGACAVEYHHDALAELALERRFVHVGVLGLTREDHSRGLLRCVLQELAGKKQHRPLENRKQHAEEQRRNQRKVDGGRTAAVAAKSIQRISSDDCCNSG